jgi:hypothetical protein
MNQEHWIEQVMRSAEAIEEVNVSPLLYKKIKEQIHNKPSGFMYLRSQLKWVAAALFFLAIDATVFMYSAKHQSARLEDRVVSSISNDFNTSTSYSYN